MVRLISIVDAPPTGDYANWLMTIDNNGELLKKRVGWGGCSQAVNPEAEWPQCRAYAFARALREVSRETGVDMRQLIDEAIELRPDLFRG